MSKRMMENDSLILSEENGTKILMIREVFDEDIVTLSLTGNISNNLQSDHRRFFRCGCDFQCRYQSTFNGAENSG